MHEMSIATGLIRQVLDAAEANDAVRVERVELTCGVMRLVVPEALQMAFEVLAEGTVAEGAELRIREEPVRARCRSCGRQFDCTAEDFLCGGCGQADVEILAGNDIVLDAIVCRQSEGASQS